jgi:hypothetical protein
VAARDAYATLEAAREALVATAPGIPEVDVAAIQARWRAGEQDWLEQHAVAGIAPVAARRSRAHQAGNV